MTMFVAGGVVAVFGGGFLTFSDQFIAGAISDAADQALNDPIFPYTVKLMHPPPYQTGHVLPDTFTDADLEDFTWGEDYSDPASANWAADEGGTFANWGQWEIALEGKRDDMVTITDIYPTQIECSEPLNGTYFPHTVQGTGEKLGLGAEIDGDDTRFKQIPADAPLGFEPPDLSGLPPFSEGSTITLDQGEQQILTVTVNAAEQYCEWVIAIEYLADGERRTDQIAPEDTGFFSVTATRELSEYETVVVPWTVCDDIQAHAVTGQRAQEIFDEFNSEYRMVDCT
ncbi:hypothetical protein [Glycomyces salinus]|uniref:hypothetical protein n=1 Tax=Glycomyces salinus TaxID=980294 RepID=UPI0018ECE7C5|nr:hypothetical protein [Glycomyces salinus]